MEFEKGALDRVDDIKLFGQINCYSVLLSVAPEVSTINLVPPHAQKLKRT